jgi:very-short-patch-repair endonuclease
MKSNIHNRKYLLERRKELRNNSTSAEATLWKSLQRNQLDGRKFRRQHSIANYIVDFYCSSEKLVIELDGAVHLDFAVGNYDYEREQKLKSLGFKVLRFENKEVFENLESLLNEIKRNFA